MWVYLCHPDTSRVRLTEHTSGLLLYLQAELADAEVNDPWVQSFVLHMDRIFKWFKVRPSPRLLLLLYPLNVRNMSAILDAIVRIAAANGE